MTKDRIYGEPRELSIRLEIYLEDRKERIRKEIYEELSSEAMKHVLHPFREIMVLDISHFNQVILYMLKFEFSVEEIAHILLSDKASIMTL